MRQILGVALLVLVCNRPALAQPLLEFRDDLAFSAAEVDGLAARSFGARLRTLARSGKLDTDAALKERLQSIVPRLIRAAAYERPDAASLQWEIHSCARCDENASAMAGGKLLISADLVARLGLGDDELAYLLAHEMAHVLAEHTREFASAARYFVDNGLARNYADIQHELAESYAVMIRMQPLYVEQELSADYIGYFLGARAGFAPQAMLSLLRKLHATGTALVATHPSDAQRMRQAETMFESARRLYASASPEGRRNAWLASVGLLHAGAPGPL
jgi:predicted Zn-dependent protease